MTRSASTTATDALEIAVTPVERLAHASRAAGVELWIKRDDRTHPLYGGNKPRKLSRILARARADGVDTLVTSGTAGSHHALATAIHGSALGFDVHLALSPQDRTEHVEAVLRATLSQRAVVHPCPAMLATPLWVSAVAAGLRARGRRVRVIPVGGTNVLGALGYYNAMLELAAQIAAGAMDGQWPDEVLVANGSGGTHAGMLAAQRARGLPTKITGVMVSLPWTLPRARAAWLADACARAADPMQPSAQTSLSDVRLDRSQLGDGYGAPTRAGDEAARLFALDGVELDPTYTAKTAAAALALGRSGRARRVLYWHTLASPQYPSLTRPELAVIPREFRGLTKG